MAVPLIQQLRVGGYLLKQRLKGNKRYPLVLMLEPLYRCNLACPGCGKIDYPDHILNQRMSVEECLAAAEECGAPVVSIPGGEPMLHKEIDQIAAGLVFILYFMFSLNATLAALALGVLPIMVYATFLFRRPMRDRKLSGRNPSDANFPFSRPTRGRKLTRFPRWISGSGNT